MRASKTSGSVRKEQIAQAALTVVERHGLRGLNVSRVAALVGVVPSGLYRHYPSKRDILKTVLEAIAVRLSANVAQARHNRESALDRMHHLLSLHLEMVHGHSGIPHVIFSEELLHGDPTLRSHLASILRIYLGQVATLVREGQQEGCIRGDAPPEAAARLFLGLIQPAVLMWTLGMSDTDAGAHVEAVWPLFLRSISSASQPSGQPSPRTPPFTP